MAGETNIGAKFYIGVDSAGNPDPQASDLGVSEFVALQWEQVPNIGNHGDTGVTQNFVEFATWDNEVVTSQKGQASGNEAELSFLDESSAGMTAMKAAGAVSDKNNYAFKVLWADGSVEFNRGLVGAPSHPKGGPEDFRLINFPIKLNQEPVFDTESV